jgi:ABC-type lipopolysaccharide export system ATPase subunit
MIQTLEADSVILEFGTKRVLQDVYLKSETAKITGLLGRNGTGKTCLLNIIYGQLSPYDHSVRLNKQALLNSSRSTKDIMYLPQFSFIPKSLTLNRIFNDYKLDFSEFINEFPEFEKYYMSKLKKLSGGEQRIVEIYLIISSKTKFCLLDEPFTHVMPLHIDSIKNLILREKKNKGIIITDHLYRHIIDICDDLYVINDGKTYLTNSIQDLETLGYATFTATNNMYKKLPKQ